MQILKKIFIFVLVAVGFSTAYGQFTVVKAAGSGKDPVSFSKLRCNGETAQLFLNVLKSDLIRSGYFEIDKDGYSLLEVSGDVVSQGNILKTQINVSWSGGGFAWNRTTSGKREARWLAHGLNDEMVKRIKGKPGMASSRIAFVSKSDGGGAIALCDSDGSSMQIFGHEKTSPLSPNFSPDGAFICYTSFIKGYPCLYRIPVKGGVREPLAKFTGLNTGGAISPKAPLIAAILSQLGNPELCVVNLNTLKATRLTRTRRAAEASPTWSPDGEYIAYVSDETGTPQVYTIDSASKRSKRISVGFSQAVAPSWGVNGKIAFCVKRGNYKIAVYDPATGKTEVITDDSADYEDPAWAADGRHIFCSRRDGRGRSSIWVFDTEGDAPYKLPLKDGEYRAPDSTGLIIYK